MAIFRKNKRQFGIRSHRRVFVALFLVGLFGISAIISFILNANAAEAPISSVEIISEHSSFENNNPGAWKINKSAEWTSFGKARITFDVSSIPRSNNNKKLDVVLVIDNSGSMSGNKMAQVKTDAVDLVDSLLSDSDNKVALITFSDYAEIKSGFTNDKESVTSLINNITIEGCTNYYDGLVKAGDVIDGYVRKDERELIILFLTDGYPNADVPNEKAQYKTLKEMYPYLVINGIQYEMGDTVLQPIIDISDNQFIADMSSLNNVLFEATTIPHNYDNFVITDYIDDTYWTVTGLEALNASLGEVGLEYEGDTPKIIWDMSGIYRSGKTAKLTIEVELKNEYLDNSNQLLPTNKHEEIESIIEDAPDENVDSPNTPILKDIYDVIYDANLPGDCEVSGTTPETTSHTVFTPVEISDAKLSCQNYDFKGWKIVTEKVQMINNNYFIMPGKDVYIYAVWAKPSISKSMDGTVHERGVATFDAGIKVNRKIKNLAGATNANYYTVDSSITKIMRADSISSVVILKNSAYILSSADSQLPIYGWYDEGVLYYYTDADDIYLNNSAYYMLRELTALSNIDALSEWNVSRTTTFEYFLKNTSITNVNALRNWNVSNATTLEGMFNEDKSLTDVSGLANWNVSNVTNIRSLFDKATSLTSLHGLENWNVSNVTSMVGTFSDTNSLQDISALSEWKTGNVTSMSSIFGGRYDRPSALNNISSLENWDTSNVTSLASAFYGSRSLTNVNALHKWDVSKVTSMANLFRSTDNLSDINALANWHTDSLTNIEDLFCNAISVTDIGALTNWDVSKVTTMAYAFYNAPITSLEPIRNWSVSNVTSFDYTFVGGQFTNVDALSGWITTKVKSLFGTFRGADKLENLNGLLNWDTSNVTTMLYLFNDTYSLTDISGIRNWKTLNVTSMNGLFDGAVKITTVEALRNWNVSKVKDMSYMFRSANSLVDISALSNWTPTSITRIESMFSGTDITNLNALSGWDITNITDLTSMFAYTDKLTDISGIRNWNVSNVTNMGSMFSGTTSLVDISPLGGWNTANVTNIYCIFYKASAISDITALGNWDVSKVKNMSCAFELMDSLSDISPLSGWITSSATDMSVMFYETQISNLDALSNWNTANVKDMSRMFYYDEQLTDICGISGWNVSNVTSMTSMFYNSRNIADLSCLNNWTTTSLTNASGAFQGIPNTIARPTWYINLTQ